MTGTRGHWNQPRRGTTTGRRLIKGDDRARLLSHTMPEPMSGCWLWTATVNAKGYGTIWQGTGMRSAHRVSYELFVGPIPDGLHIDHLCRTTGCVNPAHLEAVTPRENFDRGTSIPALAGRATVCAHGHSFTPENTYTSPRGVRRCVICRNLRSREYRARQKAAA